MPARTNPTMNRPRQLLAFAFTCLSLAAPFAAGEGEKHDLKPKFVKDQVIRYSLEQATTDAMSQGENKREAQQSQTFTVSRKVLETSEAGAKVELKVERIVASATMQQMPEMKFDSNEPSDKDVGNMLAMQFRPMVGSVYTLDVALDGSISKVTLPENAGPMANPEAIKTTYAPLFRIRAGETVTAIGDSWEQKEEVSAGPGAPPLESTAKLTLKEVKDEVASVDFNSTIAFKDGATPPGLEVKRADVKGVMTWSLKDGALSSMDGVQTMHMVNADMQVDVNSSTKIIVKRLD